jgi:DNA-binding Lrp family transcriptional regulator
LIKTEGGKAKKVLQEIKALDGVTEANGVYGSIDIIAKVEGDDLASLVVDEIRRIDGVKNTNTLIVAL